jgi:hypothetical protein
MTTTIETNTPATAAPTLRSQIEEVVDTNPSKPSMLDPSGSVRRNSIIMHIESMMQECHLQYPDLELLDVATATVDLKLAVHRIEMLYGIVLNRNRLTPQPTVVRKPGPASNKAAVRSARLC